MSTKSRVENRKKRDLARREFQMLRRQKKLMKAKMTEEERLVWRLQKAQRKAALLQQRLKKYELEEDPEPVHDPELITPEQLQALKKIGYKNRNYVPVGRRGVYGGVVQNMHMHWKKHETVQIDCHIFKRHEIRPMARQLVRLSGGIVIDIHQGTTIIMYRGRNYKQPKDEMIPSNTLSKRKALFKSKYLQALEGVNKNMEDIEFELRILRRKKKENGSQSGENIAIHEDDASRSKNTKGRQVCSQPVEATPDKESAQKYAAASLSEVSSDEDDDLFSWGSDSLDEEDLSDDQYDYKKAEEVHRSKKEAEGKGGKVSHLNKMNGDGDNLELRKETGMSMDGEQNSIVKCEENKQRSCSGSSGKIPGHRKTSDFGNLGYQKGGSRNVLHEKDLELLKDEGYSQSGLSEGSTDDNIKRRKAAGTSNTDSQMSAGHQRKISMDKKQHRSRQGKNSKDYESDQVFDEFNDEEESCENEELEGFDSSIDEHDSDDESEGDFSNKGRMK